MRAVDLHVHSKYSDGADSLDELLKKALDKKLAAIALTDHDCVSGVKELIDMATDKEIEIIPGVELSTEYQGRDIHVVGLYIDVDNEEFSAYLEEFVKSRDLRNKKMCDRLREGTGFDITYEKLTEAFPESTITRMHYARYLYDRGYIKSLKEAFDRYVGDNCPYFIPREKVTPFDAVKLIHMAGGTAILAHPILYGYGKEQLEKLVSLMKDAGLDGIEAVYSTYTPADERQIKEIASKYNLLLSGGSDYHGKNKPHIDLGTGMSRLFVPEEFLDAIKKSRNRI